MSETRRDPEAKLGRDPAAPFHCKAFPRRTAGVLLHVTALPGSGPIGNLGTAARRFIDFLQASGFGWWQVCPLGPTGFGDSPYQALSVFAGNPYLLDLDDLAGRGLMTADELSSVRRHGDECTDYGRLWNDLRPILRTVAARAVAALKQNPAFLTYRTREAHWLADWCRFSALREVNGYTAPHTWSNNQASEAARMRRRYYGFCSPNNGMHSGATPDKGACSSSATNPSTSLVMGVMLNLARIYSNWMPLGDPPP